VVGDKCFSLCHLIWTAYGSHGFSPVVPKDEPMSEMLGTLLSLQEAVACICRILDTIQQNWHQCILISFLVSASVGNEYNAVMFKTKQR
jgi:hypothetical protein